MHFSNFTNITMTILKIISCNVWLKFYTCNRFQLTFSTIFILLTQFLRQKVISSFMTNYSNSITHNISPFLLDEIDITSPRLIRLLNILPYHFVSPFSCSSVQNLWCHRVQLSPSLVCNDGGRAALSSPSLFTSRFCVFDSATQWQWNVMQVW